MFQVPNTMSAKIVKVNPRAEHHGNEEVPAVDIRLEIILPNYVLQDFDSGLLHAMYSAEDHSSAGKQVGLDIENISEYPHVRFSNLQPLRLQDEYAGYRLEIDRGIKENEVDGYTYVSIADCKVSKFVIECKEGGYVVLSVNVSKADIDEITLGRLGVLTQCDVKFRIFAPVLRQTEDDINEEVMQEET